MLAIANKKRSIIILLTLLGIGIFLSNHYRSYIYSNNLNDFGLADVGANVIVVPILFIFLHIFEIKLSNNKYKSLTIVTIFYISAEILSFFVPQIGTFDMLDIVGYIIGSCISFLAIKTMFNQ